MATLASSNDCKGGKNSRSGWRHLEPCAELPRSQAWRQFSNIDQALLQRLVTEPVQCVYFDGYRNVEYQRLTPATAREITDEDVGIDSALSRNEERSLFLYFNYCRHKVMHVLRAHRKTRLTVGAARDLIAWQRAADCLRSRLIRANMPLVKAMARRFGNWAVELTELVCEGNLTLVRCVDRFDASRGFKFSTYACRAMLAGFTRTAERRIRQRRLTPAPYDPSFERGDQLELKRITVKEGLVDDLRAILSHNQAHLTPTEERVLQARFALGGINGDGVQGGGWTLSRIGTSLGISKERVRQIQCRALDKLRTVLDQQLAPTG